MRTLLIPALFLAVFSAALMTVGWAVTRGLEASDEAQAILMVQTIADPWHHWEDFALDSAGQERADEALYY